MTLSGLAKRLRDKRQSPNLWFFSFLPNKIGAGSTINLPPLFITEVLRADLGAVGAASALTSAAAVPAAVIWGWLSDRYGSQRLYLILGFLGFGLPTLLMAFSDSIFQYYLLSLMVGALSVAGTPVSSTLIMDTNPRDHWDDAFSRFNQIAGWGVVVGRVVGLGWITYMTLNLGNIQAQRSLWIISGGLSLMGALLAWWMVPKLKRERRRSFRPQTSSVLGRTGYPLVERVRFLPNSIHYLPNLNPFQYMRRLPTRIQSNSRQGLRMIQQPLVAYYLATFTLFTSSVLAYTPFAVWQRQDLNNSTALVFVMGMVNSVAATLSYRWVGRQVHLRGSLRTQIVTISLRVIVFAGFALLAISHWPGWGVTIALLMLQVISGLSWAGIAVAGNTTVAHLAPPGNAGAAVGTYNSFVSLGSILGALISGYVAMWLGFSLVFALGALGIVLTSAMLIWILRQARSKEIKQL